MTLPEVGTSASRSLLVSPERAEKLREASREWISWDCTPRQLCDLELLLNGGFSPLEGFLTRSDYESVRDSMRLSSGALWPIPVTLDVPEELAIRLHAGDRMALRDPEGVLLAALTVEDVFRPDREAEAVGVYGTADTEHPGVAHLLRETHPWYVGGRLEGVHLPVHHDFRSLRLDPDELRSFFRSAGWSRVVAFQTRNPMHRAHFELTVRAANDLGAKVLVHPVVGMTKPGDVDHYTRIRCYRALMPHYPEGMAALSLLPLAMRMAGPREAVWHGLIRKNYGCTHLIVGRDHAGPGSDSSGRPFYGPYAAQELFRRHEGEIGLRLVPFGSLSYHAEAKAFVPDDDPANGAALVSLSGTELRRRLARGEEIPEWFTFQEVARELRRRHPARAELGFTVFLTGLSGAGKSTLANALRVRLLEIGGRSVTLLDGDVVRKMLSSELGFSRDHRDLNIRRIGFVAAEVTRAGGVAICAPIAPYDAVRREVRSMVERSGGFLLVYVSTPLPVCEARDRKGLYAKARAGIIPSFTGVSDPYEPPGDAELVIDASTCTPDEAAELVLERLSLEAYV